MNKDERNGSELSDFGRVVEGWRKANGLSQKTLAKLAGTHQTTLSGWLREGGMPAAVPAIAIIAALMDKDLSALLVRDEDLKAMRDGGFVESTLRRLGSRRALRKFIRQQRAARDAHASRVEANQGETNDE